MARPFKSGVDYFPLDVNIDDKIELLEAEHGIVGFGIWVKLLQKVYANNYWINWNNKSIIVFSSRVNVDKNSVNVIINSCLEWEIFDKKMLEKYQILTSRGIQKRFFEITKRRNRVEVIKEYLLVKPPETENIIIVNVDNNPVNVGTSTQRKGKEIETKEQKDLSDKIRLIIDYMNKKLGTKYTYKADKTVSCIKARLNEGYNGESFKTVIDKKYKDWYGTPDSKYLRPETLFGNKFEGYLNQLDESIKPVSASTELTQEQLNDTSD